MIDLELVEEIDAASKLRERMIKLSPEAISGLLDHIANSYVQDRTLLRWWESLKTPVERIAYGGDDGLSMLPRLAGGQEDAVLIVTDEEAEPWPAYSGSVADLVEVLRSCRFFEYMLAAPDASWVVFDTHSNELLRVGVPIHR